MSVVTTTVDEVPTTTSTGSQLSVVTAESDSEGIEDGDVTVLMSESFRASLDDAVKGAVEACNAGAMIRKRDGEQLGVSAWGYES